MAPLWGATGFVLALGFLTAPHPLLSRTGFTRLDPARSVRRPVSRPFFGHLATVVAALYDFLYAATGALTQDNPIVRSALVRRYAHRTGAAGAQA